MAILAIWWQNVNLLSFFSLWGIYQKKLQSCFTLCNLPNSKPVIMKFEFDSQSMNFKFQEIFTVPANTFINKYVNIYRKADVIAIWAYIQLTADSYIWNSSINWNILINHEGKRYSVIESKRPTNLQFYTTKLNPRFIMIIFLGQYLCPHMLFNYLTHLY